MARIAPLPIDHQLRVARRRLFLQTLLNRLVVAWAAALAAAALWFLAEPYLIAARPDWLRWAVAGGLVGVGTLLGLVWAIRARPSPLAAALSLDERFGLRERVTTALTLGERDRSSPAGVALLGDVSQQVAGLDVKSRFPIRLSRQAWAVPATGVALALIALFYDPVIPARWAGAQEPAQLPLAAIKENDEKMRALARTVKPPRPNQPQQQQAAEQALNEEIDQLARMPNDTPQRTEEKVKRLTRAIDTASDLLKQRQEKEQALRRQLDALARAPKPGGEPKSQGGASNPSNESQDPVERFQEELARGDTAQARKELEQVQKQLQSGQMTPQQKEQLKKELAQLKQNLDRAAQQQDKQDELKQRAEKGQLDPDAQKREQEQIDKDRKKSQDLEQLSRRVGQAGSALEDGDNRKAAEELDQAARQLEDMEQQQQDTQDQQGQLQRMQDARDTLAKNSRPAQSDGSGDENDAERLTRQKPKSSPGQGQPGQAGGQRPETATQVGSTDARARAPLDKRGQQRYAGAAPGIGFKKKSGVEMAGEIRQAQQEAAESVEVQKTPKAARDQVKGYFRNLDQGGEKK